MSGAGAVPLRGTVAQVSRARGAIGAVPSRCSGPEAVLDPVAAQRCTVTGIVGPVEAPERLSRVAGVLDDPCPASLAVRIPTSTGNRFRYINSLLYD
jgi:hypothetical protein